jgi:urease accessory protein
MQAALLAPILLLAGVAPVHAHTGTGSLQGFLAGIQHPASGIDHLLAMASVGIWGTFLGRPLIWALPIAFPLMMVVGGIFGILGLPLPLVEVGVGLSVVALGLAIAAAWRAAIPIALAVVAFFAMFHGYAHGAELPQAADPAAYAAGFVICTGLIHLAGIAFGLLGKLARGALVLRGTGAIIAAAGVWILAGTPFLG